MQYTVYKHTSPSGKMYIGITRQRPEKRWGPGGCRYKHNQYLWRAITKHGWRNFEHEIIAEGLTKEEACALEIGLIAKYQSTDPTKGYNHGAGGEKGGNGYRHTEEAKEKIAAANRGKHLSVETRKKVSEARTGRRPSAETRAKLSKAKRGHPSPNKGKKPSPSTLEKLREHANKAPVENTDTGQRFPSIHAAARSHNLDPSAICAVCNGKRKTAGGYRWEYVKEEVIV